MIIVKLETWWCQRGSEIFDKERTGGSRMDWDILVLRLTTDERVEGIATALAARSGLVTEAYIHDNIAPLVLGRNATDRESIWHDMWNIDRHLTFFPVYLPGPVDVALWDIAAKVAGLPLFRYLGACRTSLPVYASSLWLPEAANFVAEAKGYIGRGIKAYKAHVPGPWRKDMDIHAALRDAVGPDVVLMSDPVADYSMGEAVKVGRGLEALNYHWFEEPFRDFELYKYAELCRALDIPVAAAETTRGGPWGVAQVVAQRAADILRADVSWKAGVTGTLKIAHMAEAFGMRCEIHTTTMGPMDIANLHVSCAIRNCEYFELFVPEETFRFPMKSPWPIDSEGRIHVPEDSGLGIELDWGAIENQCISHKVSEI